MKITNEWTGVYWYPSPEGPTFNIHSRLYQGTFKKTSMKIHEVYVDSDLNKEKPRTYWL